MKKKNPNRRLTLEGIWFAEKAFAPAKSAAATKSCVFTIFSKVNVLKYKVNKVEMYPSILLLTDISLRCRFLVGVAVLPLLTIGTTVSDVSYVQPVETKSYNY